MVEFEPVNGHTLNDAIATVGYLPGMLSHGLQLSVSEQFDATYPFGGWVPFEGFNFNADKLTLTYAGDPDEVAIARVQIGKETVLVFRHAWVAIIQENGDFEVARLD